MNKETNKQTNKQKFTKTQMFKMYKKNTKTDLTGHSGGEVAGGTVSTALTGWSPSVFN